MAMIAGLDLGGTNIKTVLLESTSVPPRVAVETSRPTEAQRGPRSVVERLVEAVRTVAAEGSTAVSDLGGLGVAVPGTFDASTGTIRSLPNLPGWEGFDLLDALSTELEGGLVILNDARAFTLAEGRLGAGVGAHLLVGITLGTGIGGGILIDGSIHHGASGAAGEFGHQTIELGGPPCGCGGTGCLEALARPPVVAEAAGRTDFEGTIHAYRAGDERAIAAIDDMVRYLGIGLGNIVTMLGPDRIVIGGGAAQAGTFLIDAIRTATMRHAPLVPDTAVDVVGATLGTHAGAIGAALYALDRAGATA